MIRKMKIIKTNDGSHTILCNEINECFHSKHGSIIEAEHVFIKKGLPRQMFEIVAFSFLLINLLVN